MRRRRKAEKGVTRRRRGGEEEEEGADMRAGMEVRVFSRRGEEEEGLKESCEFLLILR